MTRVAFKPIIVQNRDAYEEEVLATKISKTNVSEMISFVFIIIGGVTAFVVAFVFSSTFSREPRLSKTDKEIHELRQIISHMNQELQEIYSTYSTPDTIDTIPLHYPGIDLVLSRLDKLESDFGQLKEVIFDRPEDIIELRTVANEVEALKKDNDRLREDINKFYGFNWALIGIMIAMILGLFTLAFSSLRASRRKAVAEGEE